jgi:L,D-transpeptidase YcbB
MRCMRGFRLLPIVCVASLVLLLAAPILAAESGAFQNRLIQRLTQGLDSPRTDRSGLALERLGRFYEARAYAPLWIDQSKPNQRASLLWATLRRADAHGLNAADYAPTRIAALLERGDSPAALADLEIGLSLGALTLAGDLASGRLEPSSVDPELALVRPPFDASGFLARLAVAIDPGLLVEALAPQRDEYRALQAALTLYRAHAAKGGWPLVPSGAQPLRPGERDAARIPPLRARLQVTGDWPTDAPPDLASDALDETTTIALKAFQRRHGLEPDGVLGGQTLAALNVSAAQRVTQIALNLERWRWLPRQPGQHYVLVNLAAFALDIFSEGRSIQTARVVVGARTTRTPVFFDHMTYMEINPYWHVPVKIIREEILPKAKKNPAYLASQGYVLLSDWSETAIPVDPASIDWARARAANFRYRVRQEPGDHNSLGRIKMMFPNDFDVYLHDTPAKALFNRTNRSFSHGCIRVENPLDVAATLLRLAGVQGWDRQRLDETVASGARTIVRLKAPIPVYIVYLTALVEMDDRGAAPERAIQFRSDFYGRDVRLAAALHTDLRARSP